MKYNIVTDLNYLCLKSLPVPEEEITSIIKDLEDSLDTKKGIGLSAIQIGIAKQVAIIRLPNKSINIVNPIILNKNYRFKFEKEGCLSLPMLKVDTARYYEFSFESQGIVYELEGIEAIVAQHEIAHCNGRTLLDDKWRAR